MKRLDTVGSLKLSEGFVGAGGTGKAGSSHSGGSGGSGSGHLSIDTKEGSLNSKKSRSSGRLKKDRGKPSPTALAGRTMVAEVVLPTLDKVSALCVPKC